MRKVTTKMGRQGEMAARESIGVWPALTFAAAVVAGSPSVHAQHVDHKAQPNEVLVVPSSWETTATAARTEAAVTALVAELTAHGMPLLSRTSATSRFQVHSRSATTLPQGAREALRTCSEDALYRAAAAEGERAVKKARECLEPVVPAIEAHNASTETATRVFDTCMFGARALLESAKRAAAREEVIRCRGLVPDLAVNPRMHPPEVVSLDADVRSELERDGATLRVTSSPAGCAVFANGRRFGSTPVLARRLVPTEMRVQVQCRPDHPGRVHGVQLGAETTTLAVDAAFEAAIRDEPRLSLSYPTPREENEQRVSHALSLGRILGVSDVLLVTLDSSVDKGPTAGSTRSIRDSARNRWSVRIDRVNVSSGKLQASGRLTYDASASAFVGDPAGEMFKALMKGRSVDLRTAVARPMNVWQPPPEHPKPKGASTGTDVAADSSSTAWVGWALGAGGLAGLSLGWTFYGIGYGAASERAPLEAPMLIAGGGGAAFLTSALPLLLPAHDGVPVWAWVAGAAGLGLAGFGVRELMVDGTCASETDAEGRCAQRRTTNSFGALVLFQSAPLLTAPLVYALRPRRASASTHSNGLWIPTVAFDRGAGWLTLSGAF